MEAVQEMYVLLVEDERRLAKLVLRVLEEEGHTVDTAYDGEEGLAMAMEGSRTRTPTASASVFALASVTLMVAA